MVSRSKGWLSQFDFEGINVSLSDFTDAPATGETISSGEVEEVARAEIGDDGQFSSYDVLRLGQRLDAGNGDSAKGKLFMDLRDVEDNKIDQRTEVRFVTRPKNSNRRTALTEFIPLRNLNVDRPDHRLPFTPVSVNGKPAVVKDGRILAIEIRNSATDVSVSRANSDADIPARAGY